MPLPSPFPAEIRTIGVFAPAGVPEPARLERGLARLAGWGLRVVYPGRDDPRERFLAGMDTLRIRRLHELLADPSVDLLLAARGGYGCARLLADIDWRLFVERDLPLVGYSDLTALLVPALGHGYCRGISGPMVACDFARCPADGQEELELAGVYASLGSALTGRPQSWEGLSCLRPGKATGPLVSANLSVLASLAGTKHLPDLAGAILVVEDINEAAYRIDRYLQQLDQAGVIGQLGGLVYAQFTDTEDAEWLPGVLVDFAARVPGPVAAGLEFGHAFPSCSLPIGKPFTLSAESECAALQSA